MTRSLFHPDVFIETITQSALFLRDNVFIHEQKLAFSRNPDIFPQILFPHCNCLWSGACISLQCSTDIRIFTKWFLIALGNVALKRKRIKYSLLVVGQSIIWRILSQGLACWLFVIILLKDIYPFWKPGDSLDDLLFSPPYLKTPTRVQEGASFVFSLSPNSTSGFAFIFCSLALLS